jgi:predicted deacylase
MRAHDYPYLVQRWRNVARAAGLKLRAFAQTRDGVDVFYLVTPALAPVGGMYLSAAIHGDEPASSEALITWAERHTRELRRLPLMIFPCLNPWGLVLNTRANEDGIDLNRVFHTDTSPVIVALRNRLVGHRFACALMLHEDFDGQGLYLYEVLRKQPYLGEALLAAAGRHIAFDPRAKIESRKALRGVIRRRFDAKRFARMGYPEAIHLHLHHADHAITIETPSEFAMEQRVAAHVAVIEECVRRTLGG